ncbi:MAG: M23 family metallopeptidase [Rhizobiaceae bacterium]
MRDDIVSTSVSRHAVIRANYENRITALRSQIDFIKSRQLVNQQEIENRVSELMARQHELGARERHLNKTIGRSAVTPRREKHSSAGSFKGLRLGTHVAENSPLITGSVNRLAQIEPSVEIDNVELSLKETERAQLAELFQLRKTADRKTKMLASILSKQGIRLPSSTGVGGPLIELKAGDDFLNSVNALDVSLKTLESVRRAAKSLPHGSPAPGQRISSTFGSRKDPFTGRRAVHGGLDFRAKHGVNVLATASGKIMKAGRNGGYGNMIEIDHGGGITTRYAHLSRIRVKLGQHVVRGTRIGNVGSTGRSTGPHLHYEVRRKGRVLNPIHYVRLEKHLRPYL